MIRKLTRPAPANVRSIPAPIKGWNARDSLGSMDPLDAVQLRNWEPGTTAVLLRRGNTSYATGLPGAVETLIPYSSGSSDQFFAASETAIYDITSSGAVGAADVSGLTNARFQFSNITTSAGSYAVMVNGADKQRIYDGSAWHTDGDGAPYDITGVDSATLVDVNNFKTRLWYIKQNTLEVWYLGVGAIGGAATKLDLSSVFQEGGYLVAMGTWTIDAGYGVDDYAVWATSKGEIAVYRLTDPTTPTGIALIGIWRVGAPIGRRCFYKYKGDLLLICQDGIIAMSSILQSGRGEGRTTVTDKIQSAVSTAVSVYGSNFGWQMVFVPLLNRLVLNVPVQEGSDQIQYVMNTISGAWCDFENWEANCWGIFNDNPYFGGDGVVYKAWSGFSDAGEDIQAFGLQAFNHFGAASREKQFTMIRPMLFTNGQPDLLGAINVDFDVSDTTDPLIFTPIQYGVWDTALWDAANWGSDLVPQNSWQGANGVGYWGAPVLKAAASGIEVQWVSTDVVWRNGGVL